MSQDNEPTDRLALAICIVLAIAAGIEIALVAVGYVL